MIWSLLYRLVMPAGERRYLREQAAEEAAVCVEKYGAGAVARLQSRARKTRKIYRSALYYEAAKAAGQLLKAQGDMAR